MLSSLKMSWRLLDNISLAIFLLQCWFCLRSFVEILILDTSTDFQLPSNGKQKTLKEFSKYFFTVCILDWIAGNKLFAMNKNSNICKIISWKEKYKHMIWKECNNMMCRKKYKYLYETYKYNNLIVITCNVKWL